MDALEREILIEKIRKARSLAELKELGIFILRELPVDYGDED